MKKITFSLFFLILFTQFTFAADTCVQKDQSINMCKNYGFCTMYPLGKDGSKCGENWVIPAGWKSMGQDCLKNAEEGKKYHCFNGGKVKSTICGKTNCFTCVCN
ncbi:MAG: hypothetical protein H7177_06890 [Rhizobacter sp.]|nr:hypothetical protein [Bacteriovorax sp.]